MPRIDFTALPRLEHERVIDVLTEFASDPGMSGTRFQNFEQMSAWRMERIIVLGCLCERIVGIVVPETRGVEFATLAAVCFAQIKEKLRIGNREGIQETIDSTVDWLRRNYPAGSSAI